MHHDIIREKLRELSVVTGGFAQLYIERRQEHTASLSEGALSGVRTIRTEGCGLQLILGGRRIYLYSTDVSERTIEHLIGEAPGMLGAGQGRVKIGSGSPVKAVKGILPGEDRRDPSVDPNPCRIPFDAVSLAERIRVLERAEKALGGSADGLALSRLGFSIADMEQRVTVLDSEGGCALDSRRNGRVRVHYTLQDGRGTRSSWMEYVRPQGWELFEGSGLEEAIAARMLREKSTEKAGRIQGGRMPVVFARGEGGTFWHECCGHQLEASAIVSGSSDFAGRIGSKVASSKVTLIDDGVLPGAYGSSMYDDEGVAKQKNILIENGVLKQYLCDRYHGSLIGAESNGCGRRENYTFAPTARMSNTYLAAGTDDPEAMIREIPYGLYVKALGGGSGGSIFSILCTEGYLIRNGRIEQPILPCMLTGRGAELMEKVDRVGWDLLIEQGSFCGAASGLVPVTASAPTMRISEMMVQ